MRDCFECNGPVLSKVCSVGYLTTSIHLVCINVASEYLCTLSFVSGL